MSNIKSSETMTVMGELDTSSDMETLKLIHDMGIAKDHTQQLEHKVELVENDVRSVYNELVKSKIVNNKLHWVNDSLATASQLLTVASIVPSISSQARNLKTVVDNTKIPINKAMLVSDKVEKLAGPTREKINNPILPNIRTVDNGLLVTMNAENGFLALFGVAQNCITTLHESDLRDDLRGRLEAVSSRLNPKLALFDGVQVALLNGINPIVSNMDSLASWTLQFEQINISLDAMLNALRPLINSLQALTAVFNRTITVPYGGYPKMCSKGRGRFRIYYPCGWVTSYFSFTIQQILTGATGVIAPIMNLLTNEMDKVLNPLLRALNLNISLPAIAGLAVLDSLSANLEPMVNGAVQFINGFAAEMTGFDTINKEFELVKAEVGDIGKACAEPNEGATMN
ncbi:MAG: hypothetical protein IPN76_10720 [Saprospiraceae bacterium]|nr:hypothetical protein [Saprospiraceae bacterium]